MRPTLSNLSVRPAIAGIGISLSILMPLACSLSGLTYLGAGSSNDSLDPDGGAPQKGPGNGSDAAVIAPGFDASSGDTGTTPPPGDDAATNGSDTGVDAPADTSPADAPPRFADAGAATWCDDYTTSAFCADFDRSALPSGFNASDGVLLSLTSSTASSTPNDLLFFAPAQGGGGTYGSKLSRSIAQPATGGATLAFDFYPELLNTTTSGILFAALDFLGNASAKYSVRLAYNDGVPRVEESFLGSPADIYHSNISVPTKVWSRLRVVLSFADPDAGDDAGTSSVSVYMNGVLQGAPEALSPPAGFDARPSLLIGAVYGTLPHTGWVLRYDNITLDLN